MATLRAHPEDRELEAVPLASGQSRRSWPIVAAVFSAYVTIAAMQPEQVSYFVVLAPLGLIALEVAFEVADKLDGR